MRLLTATLLAFIFSFALPLHAQPITTLTGQYGCIYNKNFGGFNAANIKSTNDGSITGATSLIYFDFSSGKYEENIVGMNTWGVPNVVMNSITVKNGTLSISRGPLTNSFNVSATVTGNGQTWVSTYLLLSVNGGATLLLQSGIKGNGDGEPATGACNKL